MMSYLYSEAHARLLPSPSSKVEDITFGTKIRTNTEFKTDSIKMTRSLPEKNHQSLTISSLRQGVHHTIPEPHTVGLRNRTNAASRKNSISVTRNLREICYYAPTHVIGTLKSGILITLPLSPRSKEGVERIQLD